MSLAEEKQYNDEMAKKYDCKPFKGPFKHVDMEAEWYCPFCHNGNEGVRLVLSPDRQSLYCTSHYEECEYSYSTLAERKKSRCCYVEWFRYPITRQEYLKKERKRCSDRLFELAASVKMLKESIDQIDQELDKD